MRKTDFGFGKTKAKGQISCSVIAQLISAFVFATRIVQSLFFFSPKFQDSSLLLGLYRPLCVRLSSKPQRPVFSSHGFYHNGQRYDIPEELS